MAKGIIKRVFSDKGFGYIQPEIGGNDIWFHASKVVGDVRFAQLKSGIQVEYERSEGKRGPEAKNVKVVQSTSSSQKIEPMGQLYRFVNPYNFVRFLSLPDEKKQIQPTNAPGAALSMAGLKDTGSKQPSVEEKLLGKCAPPPHDRFIGLTGEIVCELETITPLFISDSHHVDQKGEHKSYEFFKIGGEPALPASSLRGMIRGVFEAVTNSCLSKLTDARLSYHLPPQDALKLVPARVEKDQDGKLILKLLTGTTQFNSGQKPSGPQYAAWVFQYYPPLLGRSLGIQNNPQKDYGKRKEVDLGGRTHKAKCWALLKRIQHPRRNFTFWNVEQLADEKDNLGFPQKEEMVAEGYLCITNQNIENKHDERFFFREGGLDRADSVMLSSKVIKDYEVLIEDYRSRHKDKAKKRKNPNIPQGRSPAYSRFITKGSDERLKEGDLVYAYVTDTKEVEFVVPVSVPRVSYDNEISLLLPDKNKSDEEKYLASCNDYNRLCPACRVFGWVHEKPEKTIKQVAYCGRVSFSYGKLEHNAGTLPPIPLAILASPKPTTTRFYLNPIDETVGPKWQGESFEKGYDGNNLLRGRKFYRHHGIACEKEFRRAGDKYDDQNRTVRDAMLPGSRFRFTVRFENLAPVEVGALLWSLEIENECFHRLGFAKPLGFGSTKVSVKQVTALNPKKRYASIRDSGIEQIPNWQAVFVKPFKHALANMYRANNFDFDSLDNVRDLRAILSEHPNQLPVHYPRVTQNPDPDGKNFEWFMGNNRKHFYVLAPATDDEGLPLFLKDGTEV